MRPAGHSCRRLRIKACTALLLLCTGPLCEVHLNCAPHVLIIASGGSPHDYAQRQFLSMCTVYVARSHPFLGHLEHVYQPLQIWLSKSSFGLQKIQSLFIFAFHFISHSTVLLLLISYNYQLALSLTQPNQPGRYLECIWNAGIMNWVIRCRFTNERIVSNDPRIWFTFSLELVL